MRQSRNRIEYGDRIFARLTMGHRTVVEFMMDKVSDVSELIAELRYSARGFRGLATLHIRNQSKGWSDERPLMLYARNVPGNGLPSQSGTSVFPTSLFDVELQVPVCHQRYI